MGYFFSLSKFATTSWLDWSEIILLVSGLVLVVGIIGEYAKSDRWKRHHRVFEVLVIIGVCGELLADGGVFLFSSHLQTISDAELAAVTKKAGEAGERASAADLARVKLEASMAWRHLSDKQKHVLCSVLSPKRANLAEVTSSAQDPEAWEFANDFAAEMRRCSISGGFDPAGHLGNSPWSSDVVFGVWIRFSKNPNWPADLGKPELIATTLRKALEASGVTVEGISKQEARGLVDVYIGPRFPPHADELINSKNANRQP